MGALNRAILLGCDYFFLPMVPDLFSIRGLSNLGTNLTRWMTDWEGASMRFPTRTFRLQAGKPAFAGYVSSHFNVYRDIPTKAWERWDSQIPNKVRTEIVDRLTARSPSLVVQMNGGSYHLGDMKNYHSLIPMSQTNHKPIFELTSKDGARGLHLSYVAECGRRYASIARKVINKL